MSVRIIIPGNEVNNGNAMGYVNTLGNKKTVDRENPHTVGAYSGYDFTSQELSVSISGVTGDTTLVSGIADKQLEVLGYVFVANNDTNVSFRSAANFLTGPMIMASGGGVSANDVHLRTNAGENLIINSTGSEVHGSLSYRIM